MRAGPSFSSGVARPIRSGRLVALASDMATHPGRTLRGMSDHPWEEAWNSLYEAGTTPWDLGRPHPELVRRLSIDPSLGTGTVKRVLVPGAGSGQDAGALARAGWAVTAADLAPAVEQKLGAAIEPYGGTVTIGDALALEEDEPFDLVFDHTFFCAIDPDLRPEFGTLCRRVLAPGGAVISIVFPIGNPSGGGPPWGFDVEMLEGALGDGFEMAEVSEPFTTKRRRSPHVWARWRFDG